MTIQEWVFGLFSKPGYFVEAGAHDGIGDSCTKALEDAGWSGICIEPSIAFRGLKKNRRCAVDNRCLWQHDNSTVGFWQVPGDGIELSGIKERFGDKWDRSAGSLIQKPAVSLPTLLREHNAPSVVEFVSLDTEGSELDILMGHDFTKYRLLAVTVEHNGVIQKRDAVRNLMKEHGYCVDQMSEIEDWFNHKEILK